MSREISLSTWTGVPSSLLYWKVTCSKVMMLSVFFTSVVFIRFGSFSYSASAIQRPVAPQGSARPEAVTGRPSS